MEGVPHRLQEIMRRRDKRREGWTYDEKRQEKEKQTKKNKDQHDEEEEQTDEQKTEDGT